MTDYENRNHFNLYYIFEEDKKNHPLPDAQKIYIENLLDNAKLN